MPRERARFEVRDVDDAPRDHRRPPEPRLFQHLYGNDRRQRRDPVDAGAEEAVAQDSARHVRTVGVLVVLPLRSEEHTSELQSLAYLVCRLLLEKKKKKTQSVLTSKTCRRKSLD